MSAILNISLAGEGVGGYPWSRHADSFSQLDGSRDLPHFGALYLELGQLTRDYPDVLLRVRSMRQAGILGSSAKDQNAPQIEAVHVACGLMACLNAGPQIRTADVVRQLWRLQQFASQGHYVTNDGGVAKHAAFACSGVVSSFGQNILGFLNWAIHADPVQRSIFPSVFSSITVWRDRTRAAIGYQDRFDYFGLPGDAGDSPAVGANFIETATTMPAQALSRLALLVEESRREATRRGVEIPTEETWKALGFFPPSPTPPMYPLVELSDDAPLGAFPKIREAASLPGEAASYSGQTARGQAGSLQDQFTPSPTREAMLVLPSDRSPVHKKGNRHDRHHDELDPAHQRAA